MTAIKQYTRELNKQFKYIPTWLPGTPLKLGDIGTFKRNQFIRRSDLESKGIEFETIIDESPTDYEHTSEGGVEIIAKASGDVVPQASALADIDAGFHLKFTKEKAVVFKIKNALSHSIKDQDSVGFAIKKLNADGLWEKDWVVITEIVVAESGTILISSERDTTLDIKADGNVGADKLNIADAHLGLSFVGNKKLTTDILANSSLTPLFKVSQLKRKKFGVKTRGLEDDVSFSEVGFDSIDEVD